MEYIYNELEVLWEPTWIATCHVAANQSLEREVHRDHAKVHRRKGRGHNMMCRAWFLAPEGPYPASDPRRPRLAPHLAVGIIKLYGAKPMFVLMAIAQASVTSHRRRQALQMDPVSRLGKVTCNRGK